MKIRYADEADLPIVLELYWAGLQEIKDHIAPPDLERCADEVLFSWSQAPCVLAEKAGEIIGFAGLKTVVPPHSKTAVLAEYMVYVKPESRSSGALKMLSDEVQKISREAKIPLSMKLMVPVASLVTRAKLLKRWGYKVVSLGYTFGG